MYNKSTLFWCSFLCVFFESFLFVACSKKEYQDVLKTVYEPKAEPTELYDEFTVQLKGSALQKGGNRYMEYNKRNCSGRLCENRRP